MYKIESGVKVPKIKHRTRENSLKFPIEDMKVGDSFFVPYGDKYDRKKAAAISSALHTSALRQLGGSGFITIRSVHSNGQYGARVWRKK